MDLYIYIIIWFNWQRINLIIVNHCNEHMQHIIRQLTNNAFDQRMSGLNCGYDKVCFWSKQGQRHQNQSIVVITRLGRLGDQAIWFRHTCSTFGVNDVIQIPPTKDKWATRGDSAANTHATARVVYSPSHSVRLNDLHLRAAHRALTGKELQTSSSVSHGHSWITPKKYKHCYDGSAGSGHESQWRSLSTQNTYINNFKQAINTNNIKRIIILITHNHQNTSKYTWTRLIT